MVHVQNQDIIMVQKVLCNSVYIFISSITFALSLSLFKYCWVPHSIKRFNGLLFIREVQKAVNTAQGLHQRWMELQQDLGGASKEEVDWTTNELRNSLRSIEWDLEDLDETINILLFLVAYVWT